LCGGFCPAVRGFVVVLKHQTPSGVVGFLTPTLRD